MVTDRGEPVAELRPVEHRANTTTAKLARLRARGSLTRQQSRPLAHFTPIRLPKRVSVAALISDDREDRF